MKKFFRFNFLLMIVSTTVVFSQTYDSSSSDRIARLESTMVLLKDSVRLHNLINEIDGIIEAEKMVSGNNQIQDTSTESSIINVDSTLVFHSLTGFSRLLENVYNELNSSSVVLTKYTDYPVFITNRDRILFSFILIISLISGISVWAILRHLSSKMIKQGNSDVFQNRFAGYLFLFLSRLASGAGLSTVLFLLNFSLGQTSLGNLFFRLAIAVIIYSISGALIQMFFSKRYSQFRVVSAISGITDSALKQTSSIFSFAFLFWSMYSVSQFLKWVSTPLIIAGVYKVLFTFQVTILAYQLQKFVKNRNNNSSSGKIQDVILTIARFAFRKMYIVVFIASLVLTVSSLSGDQRMYHYLLRSILYTLLLGTCTGLSYWILIKLLNHISAIKGGNLLDRAYFNQFLVANVKGIERGGFALISIVGLIVVIRIWGLDIFRISQTEIPLVAAVVHIFFIVAAALIVMQITQLLIKGFQTKAMKSMMQNGTSETETSKRLDTLGGIFQKISVTTIGVVSGIMIIDELGFDIKAMLAGVGIVGLAVGFGAQNLVRDVISGLFIIFENRIRVGDVAIVNGTGGLVEQVNLRTIVLRSADGTIHVFPNGAVNSLSNMTHGFSYYVFDIAVAYKENVDHVIQVLKNVGESIIEDNKYRQSILEPLEIMGLDKFGSSEIIIKARIKTIPIKQWEVGREMNRRIKIAFDNAGIEIPFPHQSIYFGENSKPISVKIEGFSTAFSGSGNNGQGFKEV